MGKPALPLFSSSDTPPASICLLRLSAIGDICHAVPMVQAIQRHWPHCRLTWVIGRTEASLVEDLPGIEFVIFDKKQGIGAFRQLKRQMQMRQRPFDVLLHMQVSARSSLASLCIPARIKLGFDRARAREAQWLVTNRKIAPQQYPHVLEGFQGFARALGVPDYQPSWYIPLVEADRLWAAEQFSDSQPALIICPAASKAERDWPASHYAEVARHAWNRGMKTVVCGGNSTREAQLAEAICRAASVPCVNLVGQTTLKQLLALLTRAELLISPDTGPAHMAVAVGTPVLGLYAHSNPRRTGPYRYLQYVVNHYDENVEDQYGKSWQELPWGTRAKGNKLMQEISVEEVLAMFERIMASEADDAAAPDDRQPALDQRL